MQQTSEEKRRSKRQKTFMACLEIRRFSDPDIARGIHDAIKKTVEQKQCPIFERLFKALVIDGYKLTQRETEHQLKYAVKDGLICEVKATSNHGANKGKGLVAYRLITQGHFDQVIKTNLSAKGRRLSRKVEGPKLTAHSVWRHEIFIWRQESCILFDPLPVTQT